MTMPAAFTSFELSTHQRQSVLPICLFLAASLFAAEAWGQVPGRVTYRDGSPCAFCWLTVESWDRSFKQDRSFKTRTDEDGYFELEIETPEQIKRMKARNLRGERIVEDGFLFLFLYKDNPQLETVIKDLRKRLQSYQVFTNTTLVQQLVSENCYFIVERGVSLVDRVWRFRSVEVDLSKLELLEACSEEEEEACIRLHPARVLGAKSRFDRDGGTVFFDAKHKEHIPAVLHSIALLARSCGNLKTQVISPEAPTSNPSERDHRD